MFNKLDKKNKKLLIAAAVLFVIAIPLTILQSLKQQEIRQRAGEGSKIYLKAVPQSISANIGQSFESTLHLFNPDGKDISAFNLTFTYDNNSLDLQFKLDSPSLYTELTNDSSTPGTLSYSAFETSTTTSSTAPDIVLGTLKITGKKQASGKISFSKIQVTATGVAESLAVDTSQNQEPQFSIIAASPTPSPTPVPAATPTPTPGTTLLSISLSLEGIGKDFNNAPKAPNRTTTIELYDTNNNLIVAKPATVKYDDKIGLFGNPTVDLGTSFKTGTYLIKIKTERYLRRLIPSIITITSGQANNIPQLTLFAGDVNGDNALDVLDYNIFVSCWGDKVTTTSCDEKFKKTADVNDDGNVDGLDYNLFFRSLAKRTGD